MSLRFGMGATACLMAVAVALVACQREGEAGTPAPPTGPSAPGVAIPSISPRESALPLPPTTEAELAAVFDPLLEPYGLRLSRAALLNTSAPYEESETGRFLGLYVEPVGEYGPEDYLENLVPVARMMIQLSFDRWPGLEAVDVCQEPPPEIDDSETPPPETQLQVSREASAALDWDDVDLPALIRAARDQEPRGIVLRVSARVGREPAWRDAADAASGPEPSR